jgi:hypothetical protein
MADGGTPAPPVERRARARRSCTPESAPPATAAIGTELWPIPIRDISSAGFGTLVDRRLDPGAVVAVELLNRGLNFWHLKLSRIVHVTPYSDRLWLVGTSFLKELSDDELRAMLG